MDYEFNADEWNALTPAEREERCRELAQHAQHLAQKAPPELQPIYEQIADQWQKLASEIDRAHPRTP